MARLAILPALALGNYLGKNCLDCHTVSPGIVLGAVSMEISLAGANETARNDGKVRELLGEQRLSRIVFENLFEGITVTDANGRIQLTNPAFTDTTGYSAEEVIGRTPALLKSGRQDAVFYQAFWKALISGLAPPISCANCVAIRSRDIFSGAPERPDQERSRSCWLRWPDPDYTALVSSAGMPAWPLASSTVTWRTVALSPALANLLYLPRIPTS